MPAVVLIVWGYQRFSAPAVARARELRSDINAQLAESIAGMAVLQASNAERRFNERFSHTNREHYAAGYEFLLPPHLLGDRARSTQPAHCCRSPGPSTDC